MMFDALFKQLGFNPADLKKQVDDAAANFSKVISHFDARLDIIESQNKEIILLLNPKKELEHDETQSKIQSNEQNHSAC